MKTLFVRRLRILDIPAVAAIVGQNYGSRYRKSAEREIREMFGKALIRPLFLVAVLDGKVVGLAGFMESWMDYHVFSIFWVNVPPGLQKCGIGKSLVAEAIRRIRKKRPARLIQLTTSSPKYYSRHFGFRTAKVFGPKHHRLMTLHL